MQLKIESAMMGLNVPMLRTKNNAIKGEITHPAKSIVNSGGE